MVDIVVDPAAVAGHNTKLGQSFDFAIGSTKYVFYLSDNFTLAYRKSLDDGQTYAAEVVVFAGGLEQIMKVSMWPDWATPGDTGSKIHWALLSRDPGGGATSTRQYRDLDTSDDSLSAGVSVGVGGVATSPTWTASGVSITKAASGRLCIQGHVGGGAGDNWFVVSDDGGLIWTAAGVLSSPSDGLAVDKQILVPGTETDPDDVYSVYLDQSAPHMSLKRYNTVANVWTETLFPAGGGSGTMLSSSAAYFQYAASVRPSDGAILIPVLNSVGVATNDLNFFIATNGSTITAMSTPEADFGPSGNVAANIERVSGDIRLAYLRGGTFELLMLITTRLSQDGGLTWGARIESAEDANSDLRWVQASLTQSLQGGRWMPVWWDQALSDVKTNFNTSVAEPIPPPPSIVPPPPSIVPPGGTYGPAAGAVPGSIVYLTPPPESRVYPLVTPHHTGRFVMSFSGMGTPDIQYITQRGPNQDGETLRDFHLTPRVVQLLERQQFVDRDDWWAGRATILNELRPNRQVTATGVVTGILRMVKSDGSVRDLNVLIESGPRFEARNVNEWDEWAFEEVLRFIAFDPLFFDPTRVDFAMTFTLDLNLVFPITFPITFGSGLIDVSLDLDYTGTWASLPTIVIVGPLENPIIDNVTTGETLDLRHDVGPGETVTIDLAFGQKTITNNLGANLLGSLSTDSDLGTWHIAPTPEAPQVVGQPRPTARNVIRLRGSNPTGSTSVQVRYFTRYFGI